MLYKDLRQPPPASVKLKSLVPLKLELSYFVVAGRQGTSSSGLTKIGAALAATSGLFVALALYLLVKMKHNTSAKSHSLMF